MLEHQVHDLLAVTGAPGTLLRALAVLGTVAACESAVAALAMYGEGVTSAVIHPAGVLVAARAAGVQPRIEMLELGGRRTAVVPVSSAARRAAFAAVVSRRLAEVGVIRLSRLLTARPLSDLEVEAALRRSLQAEEVFRAGDVLCRPGDTGSAIVRPIQRMLAAGPQTAESLAGGVGRHWRYRKPDDVPDPAALEVYLAGQPAYRRHHDGRWVLRSAEGAAALLLAEDQAVIELIRAAPSGQVPRPKVAAAMIAAAYSPNSLRLLIGTSPLLVRTQVGWYGLRQ